MKLTTFMDLLKHVAQHPYEKANCDDQMESELENKQEGEKVDIPDVEEAETGFIFSLFL